MPNWPFRFVHAADLHLEMPPSGLIEAPDHLRELFIEAPYRAAQRIFDTVLAEDAEFLILSGDVLDPCLTGPRGPLFLLEQFKRLADRAVRVYWAGGRADPPDSWPSALHLPENVHVFRPGHPLEIVHRRDGTPLAHLVGVSLGASDPRARPVIRPVDFQPDPAGLFSIGVAYGQAEADALASRGIHYWALGGRLTRTTLLSSPCVVHYPGMPQGRRPEHVGAYGCTVVQVDQTHQPRTALVPTDVLRWHNERVVLDEAATQDHLAALLRQRMQAIIEASPRDCPNFRSGENGTVPLASPDLLISWIVAGSGPLLARLRRDTLGAELLATLRQEYGFGSPVAWSVSLSAESAESLPPQWYEQQTIRGDFLRAVQEYQMNAQQPLDLESCLSEAHLAGTLASQVSIADPSIRREVLAEAALLGADLLSGEVHD